MWVSRKEWEEMKKNVEELKKSRVKENFSTEFKLGILFKLHNIDIDNMTIESFSRLRHPIEKVNTSKIPCITLEELARYVLDNKPIERKEEVTKYYTKEDSNGERHRNGCCH